MILIIITIITFATTSIASCLLLLLLLMLLLELLHSIPLILSNNATASCWQQFTGQQRVADHLTQLTVHSSTVKVTTSMPVVLWPMLLLLPPLLSITMCTEPMKLVNVMHVMVSAWAMMMVVEVMSCGLLLLPSQLPLLLLMFQTAVRWIWLALQPILLMKPPLLLLLLPLLRYHAFSTSNWCQCCLQPTLQIMLDISSMTILITCLSCGCCCCCWACWDSRCMSCRSICFMSNTSCHEWLMCCLCLVISSCPHPPRCHLHCLSHTRHSH